MAEIVSLNQYRKKKAKEEKALRTAENRRKHGRTKAEKEENYFESQRARDRLDDKLLDGHGPDSPDDRDP